jgi:hypothetical protein
MRQETRAGLAPRSWRGAVGGGHQLEESHSVVHCVIALRCKAPSPIRSPAQPRYDRRNKTTITCSIPNRCASPVNAILTKPASLVNHPFNSNFYIPRLGLRFGFCSQIPYLPAFLFVIAVPGCQILGAGISQGLLNHPAHDGETESSNRCIPGSHDNWAIPSCRRGRSFISA